jgi:hypothetical protein
MPMTNKKTLIIACGLLLTLITACRKKTEPIPPAQNNLAAGYFGFLNSTKFETLQDTSIISDGGSTQAYFSSEPIGSSANPGTYISAGNNSFNGVRLKEVNSNSSIIYIDTTYSVPAWPQIWYVEGKNSIPAFTLSLEGNAFVPRYTCYLKLQDTVYLDRDNVFRIDDRICGYLELSLSSGNASMKQVLNPNLYTYTLSPVDLANLIPSNAGSISVKFLSSTQKKISEGKWVGLYSYYILTKENVVFK